MNNKLIGLAVAGSLALTACSGGSGSGPKDPIVPPGPGGVARTKVLFDPADTDGDGNKPLPVPNDLLFSGTTDLSLNFPGVSDADLLGADGTKRTQAALSKLDGWSTHAPFVIQFANSAAGTKLSEASLNAGVKLFKVTLNRTATAQGVIPPTGPVTAIERELTAGTDYKLELAKDDPSGMTLRVIPLKLFAPQASYMVVITNALQDSAGNGVLPDTTYGVMKQATPPANASPEQTALHGLIQAQEIAASSAGIARDSISLSYTFTVQSRAVMTVGLPAVLANPQVKGVITVADKPAFSAIAIPLSSLSPATKPIGGDYVSVRFGEVTVPYFSTPRTSTAQDTGPVFGQWKSPQLRPDNSQPNPFYPNLNYMFPFPAPQGAGPVAGFERIPVLAAIPTSPACVKPASGWPVTIFQHGITGNRTQMLAVAPALNNSACHAVIAIDLPMHGIAADNAINVGVGTATGGALSVFKGYAPGGVRERTFGLDLQNGAGELLKADGVPDPSGAWFINLLSLGTTRDNLRQGVSDLHSLVTAIPAMDLDSDPLTVDLDPAKVTFEGISLGGIVGGSFVALEAAQDNRVKAAVLNVPGGSVAKLLDGSFSFGPRIRAGLAASGVTAGSAAYEQFLWSAQTLADQGDPINYADLSVAKGNPLLVQEVVGNGTTNPADMVVPNNTQAGTFQNPVTTAPYTITSEGPLAGTDPLIAALGTAPTSSSVAPSATNIRAAVRFLIGHHSILLTTDANQNGQGDEPAVFADVQREMQTQTVSFLKSEGKALSINPQVVGLIVKQ